MAKSGALDGKLVVLMGGSGFIGNYVAQALLTRGARVRIASRNPEKAFKLKPLANLGQMQFARCDASDRQSVERCIVGADAVVNLVGAFDGDLYRLMGEAPGWMAEAAAKEGASAFVHVSAIAAEPDADTEIAYAGAKKRGEERVLAAFPKATILRPSILFGKDDNFINMFVEKITDQHICDVPFEMWMTLHKFSKVEAIIEFHHQTTHSLHPLYKLIRPTTKTLLGQIRGSKGFCNSISC